MKNLYVLCRALDACDASLLNKLVGIYPELAVHERSVDALIELFKKDQVQGRCSRALMHMGSVTGVERFLAKCVLQFT